jgi:Phage tail assembly chaperone protein
MGLTIHADIPIIYKKLSEVEEELLVKIETLKKDIDKLNEIVFESNILLEKDDSWEIVRKKRDFLLKSTDWSLTPGSTVDQGAWASYRQVLRDLPQTYSKSGLKSIIWPKAPSIQGPNSSKKKGHLQ